MGNKQPNTGILIQNNLNNFSETNHPNVYQNRNSHSLSEQYRVDQRNEDWDRQLKIFNFRHSYRRFLPDVSSIIVLQGPGMCSGASAYSVMVQYLPYRLGDLGALTYHQAIYILYQCVHALAALREVYGLISIEEELISFTEVGTCKLWVNTKPYSNQNATSTFLTEEQALQQLFGIVQQKMSVEDLEIFQYQKLKRIYGVTFYSKALQFVKTLRVINEVHQLYRVQVPKIGIYCVSPDKHEGKLSLKRKKISSKQSTPMRLDFQLKQNISIFHNTKTSRRAKSSGYRFRERSEKNRLKKKKQAKLISSPPKHNPLRCYFPF